ncbi:MAG: hypothetical protein JXM71_08225 [Spirochaetales bacterium]|nr:hypothetical protein [Spirochaetales bacterium]
MVVPVRSLEWLPVPHEDVVVSAARRFFVALACLTLAIAKPALADEQATTGVRVMARAGGSGIAADSESLAGALAKSPLLDAILVAPAGLDIVEAAARASCSLAVDVESIAGSPGDTRSSWRVIDPVSGAILAQGVVEGLDPTSRDLAEFWWLPVVKAAETALPAVSRTLVRVEAAPGTLLRGMGDETVRIPADGYLELALRVPGTYSWRAVSRGAYPQTGHFVAMEHGATLYVPRRELPRYSVESALFMGQFPDIRASVRFLEDYAFASAGLTQFLAGLYLVDPTYELREPPVVLSLPIVEPGISMGVYVLPPDARMRPYLSAIAFTRVVVASGEPVQLDPIAPLGLGSSVGIEWRSGVAIGLFAELSATLYPCPDGALMAASIPRDSGGSYSYGDEWFLQYPLFRVGVRVTP